MKGRDFVERVVEIGRERSVSVRIDTKRGKGSHITVYYGARKTVVKDRRKEIPAGLLSAMIRQLGPRPKRFSLGTKGGSHAIHLPGAIEAHRS